MFWFRFFGSRVRDNNAISSTFTFCKSSEDSKAGKLNFFQPSDLFYDGTNTTPIPVPAVPQTRSSRRSAIDLTRADNSVDIGPQAVIRLSFDMFSDPSYQLSALLKGYSDISTVHRGSHARILRAYCKSSAQSVIFKLYEKQTMSVNQLEGGARKELEILNKRLSTGMIQLVDSFEDDRLLLFSLIECTRGSLMALMYEHGGHLSEAKCLQYLAKPLIKALCELHMNDIVHRNVKPEHILYDAKGNLHLCDFHDAGIKGRDTFTSREGTLAYMAPEMLAKPNPEEIFHILITHGVDENDLPNYNEKVDVWSVGVVIIEALTGMLPFVSDTPEGMTKVLTDYFNGNKNSSPMNQIQASGSYSPELKDFLIKIFKMDPNDRATIGDLLCHPWLNRMA
eukprot:g4157.t1